MDRGAWRATVHPTPGLVPGEPHGQRSLAGHSAAHSRTRAWRTPWTEEPGGLQSMGSQESDTTEPLRTTRSLLSMASEDQCTEPGTAHVVSHRKGA